MRMFQTELLTPKTSQTDTLETDPCQTWATLLTDIEYVSAFDVSLRKALVKAIKC